MQSHRNITEEDLIVTEGLIAGSYNQLKETILHAPSHVFNSVDQTVRKHPILTVISALVAGGAVYEIINLISSYPSVQKQQEIPPVSSQVNHDLPGINQDILLMIIPLVAPYVLELIHQCIEDTPSDEELNSKLREDIISYEKEQNSRISVPHK
jgi:hypothetical protein